jgi:NADH dehydrogenase
LSLRNRILSMFEAADSVHGLVEDGVLNFVVIGGGPTGVEVSGAISALINKVLVKDYHDLDVQRSQVVLVDGGQSLLTPFDLKLQEYTLKSLKKRGVEVRLGTMVSEVTADNVIFADESTLKTRLVIWAGGVAASEIASEVAMEQGNSDRIVVSKNLQIPKLDFAFAVGDVAQVPDGHGGSLPQLAQPAIQGGRYVAKQILADIAGSELKDFKYFDKGIMATIGRNAAVAELSNGWRLTGPIAWLAWGFLHLVYLLGAANKISVMFSWFWSYFTFDHGPRLILRVEPVPFATGAPPDAITPHKAKPSD